MGPPTLRTSLREAASISILGAVVVGLYALSEEIARSMYWGFHWMIWSRTGAVVALAWAVGSLLVLCSRALGRIPASRYVGVGVVAGVIAGSMGWGLYTDATRTTALTAFGSVVILAVRRVFGVSWSDWARSTGPALPFTLCGVITFLWVLHLQYAPLRASNYEGLLALFLMVWSLGVLGTTLLSAWSPEHPRRIWTNRAAWVGVAIAAACAPWWFFGRYTPPKIGLVILAVLSAEIFRVQTLSSPRWRPRGMAVPAVWCGAALVFLLASDVPERYGPVGVLSLSGGTVSVLSSPLDDRDDDSYLAADSGGLDPDDSDATAGAPDHLALALSSPLPSSRLAVDHVVVFIIDALRSEAFTATRTPFLAGPESEFIDFRRGYSPSNVTAIALPKLVDGSLPAPPGFRGKIGLFESLPPDVDAGFFIFTNFLGNWEASQFSVDESVLFRHETPKENGRFAPVVLEWMEHRFSADTQGRTVSVVYFSDPHAPYHCTLPRKQSYECYLQEIEAVDRFAADVVAHLSRVGLLDETLILITADHGEEFGEHGYTHHNSNLFEPQIRVPVFVRIPGAPSRKVDVPVSGGSVPATVRDALGLAPEPTWFYPSLLPLGMGQTHTFPAPVVHQWQDEDYYVRVPIRRTAIIEGDRKLQIDWRTGRFDVSRPEESDALVRDKKIRAEMSARWLRSGNVRPAN